MEQTEQNDVPVQKRGLPGARKETFRHALSNGAVLEYRRPTGRDAERAAEQGGDGASQQMLTAALVASVATVDGEAFTPEEFLEMDLLEINEVNERVVGKPQSPASET